MSRFGSMKGAAVADEIAIAAASAVRPQGFSPEQEIAFYGAFDDYEVYRLQDVTAIEPLAKQPWGPLAIHIDGTIRGGVGSRLRLPQ